MAANLRFRRFIARLTLALAAAGTLPLIYLGLITPHVETAALIGGSDIIFATIIAIQSFYIGRDSE